jgi:hypothetical protein
VSLVLTFAPIAIILVILIRGWPMEKPFSSRLSLLLVVVTLIALSWGIVTQENLLGTLFLGIAVLSSVWCYRKAVQGEIHHEEFERRRREREQDG